MTPEELNTMALSDMDGAMDSFFGYVDDLLSEGQFDAVDSFLRSIDVDTLDSTLLVGVLTITGAGRSVLPFRAAFFDAVQVRLAREISDPDELRDTLHGLQ